MTGAAAFHHQLYGHGPYLPRSRLLECSIVWMNVAVLPSSITCTLGTPGTDGPDRITRNLYDNAAQLLKFQKAYLITTAKGFPANLQQDYVTYAYTPKGKQEYVTDATGNTAQFTWDGFDRLSKWNFPSPTTVRRKRRTAGRFGGISRAARSDP